MEDLKKLELNNLYYTTFITPSNSRNHVDEKDINYDISNVINKKEFLPQIDPFIIL